MRKEIVFCGDSYWAGDTDYPGQSVGELLTEKNNLNLVTFARGGCCNFSIALQIDWAIGLKPDIIIVGCTSPERMVIPILDSVKDSAPAYDKLRGLHNINYKTTDLAYQFLEHTGTLHDASIYEHLTHSSLTKSQQSALKDYITLLYDVGIKQQYDCWIMSDAVRRLQNSNIPYLIYIEPLFNGEFSTDAEWIPDNKKITPRDFSYYNLPESKKHSFHTTLEGSRIFADYLETRLIKNGFL